MTTYAMPARKWANEPEPEAPRPTVLVSSRDDAPVPHVGGAARVAKAAAAAGWTVRQTYSLADVPAMPRMRAHRLAKVVVRLARGQVLGWGAWCQIDGGPWRYDGGMLATRKPGGGYAGTLRVGARDLMAALFKGSAP